MLQRTITAINLLQKEGKEREAAMQPAYNSAWTHLLDKLQKDEDQAKSEMSQLTQQLPSHLHDLFLFRQRSYVDAITQMAHPYSVKFPDHW